MHVHAKLHVGMESSGLRKREKTGWPCVCMSVCAHAHAKWSMK